MTISEVTTDTDRDQADSQAHDSRQSIGRRPPNSSRIFDQSSSSSTSSHQNSNSTQVVRFDSNDRYRLVEVKQEWWILSIVGKCFFARGTRNSRSPERNTLVQGIPSLSSTSTSRDVLMKLVDRSILRYTPTKISRLLFTSPSFLPAARKDSHNLFNKASCTLNNWQSAQVRPLPRIYRSFEIRNYL